MFKLKFSTDNDAFQPDAGPEVARILRELANRIDPLPGPKAAAKVRDLNGNTVGAWEFAR